MLCGLNGLEVFLGSYVMAADGSNADLSFFVTKWCQWCLQMTRCRS